MNSVNVENIHLEIPASLLATHYFTSETDSGFMEITIQPGISPGCINHSVFNLSGAFKLKVQVGGFGRGGSIHEKLAFAVRICGYAHEREGGFAIGG